MRAAMWQMYQSTRNRQRVGTGNQSASNAGNKQRAYPRQPNVTLATNVTGKGQNENGAWGMWGKAERK